MTVPDVKLPYLARDTIVPDPEDLPTFLQYLTRLYEDISICINSRDFIFFPIAISDVPTRIPNIPRNGAFLVCVSYTDPIVINGIEEYPPASVWALAKASPSAAGAINVLSFQAGVGATWGGIVLTITCPAPFNDYLIAHNLAATTASFNIRIIGTQLV